MNGLLALALASSAHGQDEYELKGMVSVDVGHPERVADLLIDTTEASGGWFLTRTPSQLVLVVPREKWSDLLHLAEEQGRVLGKNIERTDQTPVVDQVRTQITAYEAQIAQYRAALAKADPRAAPTLRSQLSNLTQYLDTLNVQLLQLKEQYGRAVLEVNLHSEPRGAPTPTGDSSFAWLDSLDVDTLEASVRARKDGPCPHGVRIDSPPEGFAALDVAGSYRAISPERVVYRVRTVEHQRKADVAFWREAVRTRMAASGYDVVSEGDLTVGGVPGGFVEVRSAVGTDEWTYRIAFAPQGRRVLILEAAGEVDALEGRRAAIDAATSALTTR